MKKFFGLFFAFVAMLILLPSSSDAAGAISANEQEILTALNQGITTKEGQSFYFSATDIQQAENDLKTNDYDVATTTEVVNHINAARQLVIDNSAGIKANSLNDLLRQLPKGIQNQISDHIFAAANVLGLSVDENFNISRKDGTKVIVPTTTKNPVVKATGFSGLAGIITVVSLIAITAGLGFATKRKALI